MNETKVLEKFLVEIWKKQDFVNEISTETGEKIEVISVGEENKSLGGPDFTNASIRIGNYTFIGDVEIDGKYSDWFTHGHNLNQRFNKVILHAVFSDNHKKQFVYNREGRAIPSVNFNRFLASGYKETIHNAILSEKEEQTHQIHCSTVSELAAKDMKMNVLTELGADRFKKKCHRMLHRLKELVFISELQTQEPMTYYGSIPGEVYERDCTLEELSKRELWEQLFYEYLLEALGYTQNKSIFLKISQSLDLSFLRKYKGSQDFVTLLESFYFTVSGLIPEPSKFEHAETSEYLRTLSEFWQHFGKSYDGEKYSALDFHFSKLRPPNFPTIRLAGAARLTALLLKKDLLMNLFNIIKNGDNLIQLKRNIRQMFIVQGDGYWTRFHMFDVKTKGEPVKFFVGSNRADEIFLNVALPYAYLYFDTFGDKHNADKILDLYSIIELQVDNALVKDISDALKISERYMQRSIMYQGAIELFRSFCTKGKCLDCKIGQAVFDA